MIYAIVALIHCVLGFISGNTDYYIIGAALMVAFEVCRLRDYFEEAEDDD